MNTIILTEGGSKIGFGHITRCVSLYHAFKNKGARVSFIVNGDSSVKDPLRGIRYTALDWLKVREDIFRRAEKADIVLIDSYLADKEFYKNISKLVRVAAYMDDFNRMKYPKGFVINGIPGAKALKYLRSKDVKYLLGIRYMTVRKEFCALRRKPVKEGIPERVMVTFGGNDIKRMVPKVLRLLAVRYPDMARTAIVGKGFSREEVDDIEYIRDKMTELVYSPSPRKMKALMGRSDLAVSGAGQTLYELASLGVPTIAVAIADNQFNNIKSMLAAGAIKYAGRWNDDDILEKIAGCVGSLCDRQSRRMISNRAERLMGHKGADRIVGSLLEAAR